eukprot:3932749-Pyramimonas_sp.AAC.1
MPCTAHCCRRVAMPRKTLKERGRPRDRLEHHVEFSHAHCQQRSPTDLQEVVIIADAHCCADSPFSPSAMVWRASVHGAERDAQQEKFQPHLKPETITTLSVSPGAM